MEWLNEIARRLRSLLRRERFEQDLDQEISAHLDIETDENIAAGLPPEEARYAARRAFGNITSTRESTREVWMLRWFQNLWRDLRFGARGLAKSPGFTTVAVITLALGIGANTAIFSVVHAVLLRPIPYPAEQPDRVLLMQEKDNRWPTGFGVAYPDFKDWQRQNQSFTKMAAFRDTRFNMTGTEEPIRVPVRLATLDYFEIMGIKPLAGRLLTKQEDQPGAAGVALLNYTIWRNRFESADDAIGRTLRLNERVYTVIGILPPGIDLVSRERVFLPLEQWADNPETRDRGNHQDIFVLGRLRTGVTMEQAQAEMEAIARRLAEQYPATNSGVGVRVHRLNEFRTEDYRQTLFLLLGAVSLVLLIACVNVANLLTARAVNRRREGAIRAALGASRLRIIQQALTEGVLLALAGAALGIVPAFAALNLLRSILPADVPRLEEVAFNWPVLVYTLGISCLTGLLFGLVPVLTTSHLSPTEFLKEGGRTGGSLMGRRRWARALPAVEVGLATVLLIGAGLLVRTMYELTRVDPGFRADNLLKMHLGLTDEEYTPERRIAFFGEVQRRLEALPGVTAVTTSLSGPMLEPGWRSVFVARDKPVAAETEGPIAIFNPVDPGFFETFGIPLKQGRLFEESDTADSRLVVVINETLAKRVWPGENPIGKLLRPARQERVRGYDSGSADQSHPWREVVGVVGDSKQYGLDQETQMEAYFPFAQQPLLWARVSLRTSVPPMNLAASAKQEIHSVNPNLPVYEIESMDEIINSSTAPRRFTMTLLGIFASLALVLAAVGIYGVIAYSVARRTQEIGVRLALGAQRKEIFRLVVGQGMRLAAVGALAGMALALVMTRMLGSLLYGVSATDPAIFVTVPVVLVAVAFMACCVPAIRAVRVDPMAALRYE